MVAPSPGLEMKPVSTRMLGISGDFSTAKAAWSEKDATERAKLLAGRAKLPALAR